MYCRQRRWLGSLSGTIHCRDTLNFVHEPTMTNTSQQKVNYNKGVLTVSYDPLQYGTVLIFGTLRQQQTEN